MVALAPAPSGGSVVSFLEQEGLPARTPPLRASDWELGCSDPFAYYLRVRLGITHALSWSEALNRGSWFHRRLECFPSACTEEALPELEVVLEQRKTEIVKVSDGLGLSSEKIQRRLDRETQDFRCALVWFDAATSIAFRTRDGHFTGTVPEYLSPSRGWRLIASELLIVAPSPLGGGEPRCVAQLDQLWYHEPTNSLWILDAKTCDEAPEDRLQTCPIEFATSHYQWVLRWALREGVIHLHFDLPKDVTIGGMMHWAVQKPSIEMCNEDRDHRWYEHTLKSGKRKGQIEMRKEYLSDEPRFENYLARCQRWLRGEGEYLDKQAERSATPPVDVSFTPSNLVFDDDGEYAYRVRLNHLTRYATQTPHPRDFPMNPAHLRRFGRLDELTPFYLSPPQHWPEIMLRNGFTTKFRDDFILLNTAPGIY